MNFDVSMPSILSRRNFLYQTGGGFGGLALAHLLGSEALGNDVAQPELKRYVERRFVVRLRGLDTPYFAENGRF